MPVIGWQGRWANTLRLWAAEAEMLARRLSRVLYPDDSTNIGKELRLKQEHFFTAASLRELIRRDSAASGDLRRLAGRVARSGWFRADRTIAGYMRDIWQAQPMI